MDLKSLERHMPSIDEGRWVDATEIPALLDIRVKVRGASATEAREMFAAKERAADPRDRDAQGRIKADAMSRIVLSMIGDWSLVDIKGLTDGDKELTAEEVGKLVMDPAYQPLADLIMHAAAIVDQTRADQVEATAKN